MTQAGGNFFKSLSHKQWPGLYRFARIKGMGYKRRVGLPSDICGVGEQRALMRVIAGTWRGLRLASVPGTGTRPTADRVKEAIFSRLESRYVLDGANVLDLYAGTGALGIEALSRGAATLVSRLRGYEQRRRRRD